MKAESLGLKFPFYKVKEQKQLNLSDNNSDITCHEETVKLDEISSLKLEISELKKIVSCLLKMRNDSDIADNPIQAYSSMEIPEQQRERVMRVLKDHFRKMALAEGVLGMDMFRAGIGVMGVYNADDKDENGRRIVMGAWGWGRFSKYINYVKNKLYDADGEKWRTLGQEDFVLTSTLSLGEHISKTENVTW